MAQTSIAKPFHIGTAFGLGLSDFGPEPDSTASSCKMQGPKRRPFRHYRRSTTSKAPRKRTFVMNMSKYTAGLLPRPNGVAAGSGFAFQAFSFNLNDDEPQKNPADHGSGGAGHGRDPNLVSSHRVQTARFLLSRDMAVLAAAAALRPALLALHISALQLAAAAAPLHSALAQKAALTHEQQQQQAARQQQQQEQLLQQAAQPPPRSPAPPADPPTRKRRSPFQAALQAAASTSTPASPSASDPAPKHARTASPPPPAHPDAFLHATLGHPATIAIPHLTLGPLLGSGAHGHVYSGTWAGRPAAIKLATPPAAPHPPTHPAPPSAASSAAASLSREAHLLPTLSHPNIVSVLHASPAPPTPSNNAPPSPTPHPTPLLVMELLPHGSLDALLHGPHAAAGRAALLPHVLARHTPAPNPSTMLVDGPTPPTPTATPAAHRLVLLSLLRDAAAALHHIHTRPTPIVHRDLKPDNILVSPAATAKLSDFGVAIVLDAAPASPTHRLFAPAADVFGTVQYSAPEDLWGVGSNAAPRVGPAADVFSLGCVLWEVLAGARPWEGLDTVQVMYGVGSGGKRLPLDDAQGWPAELVALMRACWLADPALRPTAQEACLVLERHVRALAAQVAAGCA